MNVTALKRLLQDPNRGIVIDWGTTVPADATVGYAPGAIFIHTDGTGQNGIFYGNRGTKAASDFDAILVGA